MAARASLQLPHHLQILTPIQFFEWSSQNQPNINIRFSKIEEYNKMKVKLEDRFRNAKPIPATHKIHKMTPLSNCIVEVKAFSHSDKLTYHSTIKKSKRNS